VSNVISISPSLDSQAASAETSPSLMMPTPCRFSGEEDLGEAGAETLPLATVGILSTEESGAASEGIESGSDCTCRAVLVLVMLAAGFL